MLCCHYVCFSPYFGWYLKGVRCTKAFLAHFLKTYVTATQNIRNGNTPDDAVHDAERVEQRFEQLKRDKLLIETLLEYTAQKSD